MASRAGRSTEPERTRSPWFPFGTAEDAPVRLLCLPHAGAGAALYRTWGRGLPATVAACPVQPPGRGARSAEQPLTSAREVARQLAPEVLRTVRPPYAIFGHSAGALCAFEVVREIRRLGGRLPVHLFVSGRRPPSMPVRRTELVGLSLDELVVVLRRLGGTPEEVLAEPVLLELIQPLLVADFHVNQAYRYRAEPRLPIPITTFASTRDPFAEPAEVAGWQEETSERYAQFVLDGDHFAIFEHAAAAFAGIAVDLEAWHDAGAEA